MSDKAVLWLMFAAMILAIVAATVLYLEYWWLYKDYIHALIVMSNKCICYEYNVTGLPLI